MTKTPNYDAKIAKILAETKPGERVCALTGEKWLMTDEEIGWYKKFNVPPHPWSPTARLKHLMGFPSGIAIWKKSQAETGEPILTFVHPDSPYKVIEDKDWFNREFAQGERDLDPARSFFDQFKELAYSVPLGALRDDGSNINCVGVDIIDCQDCYMLFGGYGNKRDLYSAITYESEDSCLLTNTKGVKSSFMINACDELHGCRYCFQNGKLINCTFCFASDNLENCFGASNQRHKKFLFFNEQLSEAEWRDRVSKIDLGDREVWEAYIKRFHRMVTEESFWPPNFNEPLEDCTGEYLLKSTRCHNCYWIDSCLDLYYCWVGVEGRESAFSVWLGWGDHAYLSSDMAYYSNAKFCSRVWRSQDTEYCIDCYNCEYCFGCVGLQRKKFCILNKQYTEEEYWPRLDEIKCAMLKRGEYGLFFPAELSQPGFQFSMGALFVGYSEAELKAFGAPTFDATRGNIVAVGSAMRADDLPDKLDEVDPNRHIGQPILDEHLGRLFTITATEFAFYQKHRVPIPREHFLTRLTNLFRHSNGPMPEQVHCLKCGVDVTTYGNALFSGRRRVLCRPCYLGYLEERG